MEGFLYITSYIGPYTLGHYVSVARWQPTHSVRIRSWPPCKRNHFSIQTFTVHGEADGACNYSLRGRLSTSRQLRHPLFKPPQSFLVRICARTLRPEPCTPHIKAAKSKNDVHFSTRPPRSTLRKPPHPFLRPRGYHCFQRHPPTPPSVPYLAGPRTQSCGEIL